MALQASKQLLDLPVPEQGSLSFAVEIEDAGFYALATEHLPDEFALSFRRNGTVLTPNICRAYSAAHSHDDEITSVGITLEEELSEAKFSQWLRMLLSKQGEDIFRSKGILNIAGQQNRVVFQGVHMLMDFHMDRAWQVDESRKSEIVFIGRGLDRLALTEGVNACRI